MFQPTPTRNPRGGAHYDEEEDLPYLKSGEGGEGSSGGGDGPSRPAGAGRTSSRDANPSSRHRKQKQKSSENLGGAESHVGDSSEEVSPPVAEEQAGLAEATGDDPNLYNHEGGKKGIRNWSRRKKAGAGFGAGVGLGIVGVFLMGVGPFQFIQLAQSLQNFHYGNNESMMDGRASRLVYYGRGARERGNLGFFSNAIADVYEGKLRAAGLEPSYRNPDTGASARSIQSFKIDPKTPEGQQALLNLRANNVDIPAVGPDGKITIPLRGRGSQAISRKVIRGSLSSIGVNRVSSWIGGRLMIRRADVSYSWLKRLRVEGGEDIADAWRNRNLEVEEKVRTGATTIDTPRRPSDAPDVPGADDDVAVPGDPDATARNISDLINGGLGAVGLLALICTLDKFGDSVGEIQQSNVVLPLIRTGSFAISAGNQVMSNQNFNMEDLGALSMRLFDPDTGLGWSAAKSIQAEWGVENPSGPDMPDATKPGRAKPLFFEQLDRIISTFGLQRACDLLNSPAGGAIVDIADIILSATTSLASFILELLAQAGGAAAAPFIQDLARWLAGEPLEEFAQGAVFGNYANYGARLMANDSAVSTGGVELTGTETALLDADRKEAEKLELQSKNVFARLFDPYEPESLVAKTVLRNPNLSSTQAATNHFAQLPTTVFNQIGSSFANIFSPKLQALNSSGYDYGFPEYGYSLALQEDARFDDPYENGEIVEALGLDSGEKLNDKYGEPCFNVTISESGTLTTLDTKPMEEIPDFCKGSDEKLLRYRFYVADTIAAKSLACLEDIDEGACSELGLTSGATAATGGGGSDTPTGNIVDVPGLSSGCDASIADDVARMIQAAAADGVTLTGSCWRSPERQIELRRQNCGPTHYDIYVRPSGECSPPTAIPGTSNHERGLAIDFDNCSSQSTACFIWLAANAANYGLQNLESEPWHWSVDGS